jgi:hypothetical protein
MYLSKPKVLLDYKFSSKVAALAVGLTPTVDGYNFPLMLYSESSTNKNVLWNVFLYRV